jgi:phage terminase large subunit-like protein
MNGRAGGNAIIIITKQASGTARVDALMAALNAIALMSTNPRSAQPSIFVI